MAANIELHGGIVFSQQVLTALIVEAEMAARTPRIVRCRRSLHGPR